MKLPKILLIFLVFANSAQADLIRVNAELFPLYKNSSQSVNSDTRKEFDSGELAIPSSGGYPAGIGRMAGAADVKTGELKAITSQVNSGRSFGSAVDIGSWLENLNQWFADTGNTSIGVTYVMQLDGVISGSGSANAAIGIQQTSNLSCMNSFDSANCVPGRSGWSSLGLVEALFESPGSFLRTLRIDAILTQGLIYQFGSRLSTKVGDGTGSADFQNAALLGVSFSDPSFVFKSNGGFLSEGNILLDKAEPVSAPATLALLVLGIAGFGLGTRRN